MDGYCMRPGKIFVKVWPESDDREVEAGLVAIPLPHIPTNAGLIFIEHKLSIGYLQTLLLKLKLTFT